MALARPWVIKIQNKYYMWFSAKNNWLKGSIIKFAVQFLKTDLNGKE